MNKTYFILFYKGFIPFFTKEKILPLELRNLPYDVNSVMHFGERDYSKNGHRSFIFKNQKTRQSRIGLSKIDLRKIKIIYGPECQKRDRQAKIDICKKYPSVRRKREINIDTVQNLKINRDITPPPEKNLTDEISHNIKEFKIDEKVQDLIELVHKMTAAALENERVNICNHTNTTTRKSDNNKSNISETQHASYDTNVVSNDMTMIIEVVIQHVKAVVNNAKTNLTVFCDNTNTLELFQRARCGWGSNNRCPESYKSTKSGLVKHSTKHRPFIRQSTKHEGNSKKVQYVNWLRSNNDTQEVIIATRRKRDIEKLKYKDDITHIKFKLHDSFSNIVNYSKRRKRDTEISNKTDLNKIAIERIDSFKSIGNNAKESTIAMNKRRKQKAETPKLTNLTIKNTKTISTAKIRKKREDDTIILSDTTNNVIEKTNGSLVINTDNAVKESLVKTDETVRGLHVNGSKDALRMVTRVYTDKKVDFAPVRRSNRNDRELSSRNRESDSEEQRDDSSSSESDVRNLKTTRSKTKARDRDENRERVRERPRERDKHRMVTEDRPQKRRPKGKRERQRPLVPETVPLTKGNKEFYAERIWPDGVVRYVIAQDSTYILQSIRERLAEVNDILKKKTCVRIEEVSEKEGERYNDYLVIDTSADYVTGRVGGRQNFGSIELFEGGQHRQHAAMMVMAMLGFYFEPSRHDRDQFVRVHNRHIRPDKLHHFEKIRPEATLNLPYDYTSATHPAWQFWRRVGRTGISSVATFKDQDPDGSIMKSLGQNEKLLSDVDIIKINSIYGVHCFQNQRQKKMRKKKPVIV